MENHYKKQKSPQMCISTITIISFGNWATETNWDFWILDQCWNIQNKHPCIFWNDNREQRMAIRVFFFWQKKSHFFLLLRKFALVLFDKTFSKLHRKTKVTTLIIRQGIADTVDELRQMLMAIVKTGLVPALFHIILLCFYF